MGRVVIVMLVAVTASPLGTQASDPVAEPYTVSDFMAGSSWGVDLETLADPHVSAADGIAVLEVSASGEVVIAGLDNGGALFLDAGSGEVLATVTTTDHGAVRWVDADHDGGRAVFVYEDGYVAAVDSGQQELLMSRFREVGASPGIRDRVGAAISQDGRTLVVTSDRLQLFALEGEPPAAEFALVEEREASMGPHVLLHPTLPYFAVLDPDGTIGVHDLGLEPQHPPVRLVDSVAAVAMSEDGGAFAVIEPDGDAFRYEVRLVGSQPELELRYEQSVRCTVPTCGSPYGVALDSDGSRVLAWTNQQVLWAQGDNRGVGKEEARRTDEAMTVRLTRPVDNSWRFGGVAADGGLEQVLATRVDSAGAARPVEYSLPSATRTEAVLVDRADPNGVALDPVRGRAFVAYGGWLGAFPTDPSTEAVTPDDGDQAGEGFPMGTVLASLGGVAVLVAGGVLVGVMRVARRSNERRLLTGLDLDEGPLAPPASARPSLPGGGSRGVVRQVLPSAPAEEAPPEGLFVLDGFTVPGDPPLRDLRLFLGRPGVVRLAGNEWGLSRLGSALRGRIPASGGVSAGGADRSMTPLLFSRHLRVGLQEPPEERWTARAWYERESRKKGVPTAVGKRRLQADLGWMGERLNRPYRDLPALDRWKVRLAVAFLDRPRVLLVWSHELPFREAGAEQTVRRVLAAVGRHYRAVVVVLDPGSPVPEPVVRSWAHEELRLGPDGFQGRSLLHEGRRVSMDAAQRHPGFASNDSGGHGKNGSRSNQAPRPRATRRK